MQLDFSQMTKLITFDFWNTIFDSSDGEARNSMRLNALITEIKRNNRLSANFDFNAMFAEIFHHFNDVWIKQERTPDAAGMVDYIAKKFNLTIPEAGRELIIYAFDEAVLNYPPQLTEGFAEALAELDKHFQLAIVCDTGFTSGKTLRTLLNTESILHFFEGFSFSDETQVAKPNSRAFMTVLDRLGVKPSDAIHIGDNERTDIFGAKSLGMRAVHFTGDQTSKLIDPNVENTAADFESDNWKSIAKWILSHE